nr:hypothetical protein [Tanacetum cinerariifolium]
SSNDPIVNPSLSKMLLKSVFIQSYTVIRPDGRVQSYCGLKLADIPASDSAWNSSDFKVCTYACEQEIRRLKKTKKRTKSDQNGTKRGS